MSRNVRTVYLRDHAAATAGGAALAGRAASNNEGSDFGRHASEVASELERHDAALAALMGSLGIRPSRLKRAGALLAERAGRLKLNGRLASSSPLAPVVEAEGLMAILGAQVLLWEAVAETMDVARVDGVDPRALADQARGRLAETESHRLRLLRSAFG